MLGGNDIVVVTLPTTSERSVSILGNGSARPGGLMLTAPVPTWIESALVNRQVDQSLAEAGLLAVPLSTLAAVRDEGADVCIVRAESLLGGAGRPSLQRCALTCPRTEFLVLSPRGASTGLATPRTFWFCASVSALPAELFRLRLRRWKQGLIDRIRKASHLPFALREALVAVVRQDFPGEIDTAEFKRTIGWAAQRAGVRREHLSRLTHSAGIDFRSFADSFASVLAVADHTIDRAPWGTLAIRMGFRWQSGLTTLVKRGLGHTPTAALDLTLDELLVWWERAELRGILGE